jgi:hypothetical protein
MRTRGRKLAAALLLLVACERGSGTAHAGPQPSEHPPPDAPQLWLHPEGEGRSRIVLVTAGGAILREWRSGELLDEKTRGEVRAALDEIAPPSHAVAIKVRKDVKFKTLKSLMLAAGSPDPGGYRTFVHPMTEFPPRIMAPGASSR